ncbi:MAG TPA: PAS domain S-box protein, partial [Gammaproteobacteria bacterium]|nr:PAS domain S-box protein [Gammaproteobacteria bacterium]
MPAKKARKKGTTGKARHRGGASPDAVHGRLASILDASDDAIIGSGFDGVVTDWTRGAERMFGYTVREMVGTSILQLFPPEREKEEAEIARKVARGESVGLFETQRKSRDGRLIDVLVKAAPIRDAGTIVGVARILRDITSRKEQERQLLRMTRLYAAFSQVSQAISHTQSMDELFGRVCRALVEHGGFRMAWIGWHDPQTRRIAPRAVWGDTDDYIRTTQVYSDERPEGMGPSGRAFRSGKPYICRDIAGDPATLLWRAELLRRGYKSAAFFPISGDGEVNGVLNVFSDDAAFFQDKEINLLEKTALDVSSALGDIRERERRRQAELTADSERLFSATMIESLPGILYFYDQQGRFLRWNRNFETVSGYSAAEIAGMHPLDFFRDAEKALLRQRIDEVFEKGDSFVEAPFLSKDGRTTDYFFTGRRVLMDGKPCLVGVGIDISLRRRAEEAQQAMEGRYRSLFEHAPDGIVVADTKGFYLDGNPSICRMLGYSHEELVRLHSSDIVVPEELDRIEPAIDAIEAKSNYHNEWRFRRKDGSVFPAEVFAAMMPDGNIMAMLRDITERKRLESELALRERRLDAFFNNAPAGMMVRDRELRYLQVNETLARIYGRRAEEFPGKTARDLIPKMASKVEPILRRVLETGEPVLNAELSGETPAQPGVTRYWTASYFPIPGEDGKPAAVGSIVIDVTDQKQAEEERDRLFDLSLDMLSVADFEGRLLHVSPAWTECLGWSAEELTRGPMIEYIHPDDHAATREIRRQIYAGTPVRGFQNRYRHKDGSYRWFSWSVHPMPELQRVFAVARDVTEQRDGEEAAHRREEQQRRLVEEMAVLNNRLLESQAVAGVGSWETDLKTMEVTWSDETYRIFKQEPVVFKPTHAAFLELVHSDDRDPVNEAFQASMGKPGNFAIEHRILLPGGETKTVEERWRIFNDETGTPIRAFGTCQDITQRKNMETQLLRAQRLESIGTLAGGIAHDLNNVLAPIMVAADMLEMDLKLPKNLEVVRMIKSSARRAADLVKQVLSFSRGAEGQRVPVDVEAVVQDLNKLTHDTFPKNIAIETVPARGLWRVKVDPTQLHQVLLNLYVNARDAMP